LNHGPRHCHCDEFCQVCTSNTPCKLHDGFCCSGDVTIGANVVRCNARGGDLFTSACELQDNGLEHCLTLGFKSPSELGFLDKSS
jgi:hypothetical protein